MVLARMAHRHHFAPTPASDASSYWRGGFPLMRSGLAGVLTVMWLFAVLANPDMRFFAQRIVIPDAG
jgi:hypothetical protein